MTKSISQREADKIRVRISSPSRLHLGDLDPYGLGRFGYALLVGINSPRTIIEIEDSDSIHLDLSELDKVEKKEKKEIRKYSRRILENIGGKGAKISVISRPPRHYGFGSTTQLVLSLGMGILLAYGKGTNPQKIMKVSGRTSAGGIHTFSKGGFLISGGFEKPRNKFRIENGEEFAIPHLILRKKFPEDWRFVVAWPKKAPSGADEKEEKAAFNNLQKLEPPKDLIHKAHFLLNTKLIPSIINEDPEKFGKSLKEIQYIVGTLYSPVQDSVYNPASEDLIELLDGFEESLGVGQSSWGPGVYSFVSSEKHARKIAKEVQKNEETEVHIAKPDNEGVQNKVLKYN